MSVYTFCQGKHGGEDLAGKDQKDLTCARLISLFKSIKSGRLAESYRTLARGQSKQEEIDSGRQLLKFGPG